MKENGNLIAGKEIRIGARVRYGSRLARVDLYRLDSFVDLYTSGLILAYPKVFDQVVGWINDGKDVSQEWFNARLQMQLYRVLVKVDFGGHMLDGVMLGFSTKQVGQKYYDESTIFVAERYYKVAMVQPIDGTRYRKPDMITEWGYMDGEG